MDEAAKIAALRNLWFRSHLPDDMEAVMPAGFADLPSGVHSDLAVDYLNAYRFDRTFDVYVPRDMSQRRFIPTQTWGVRSRAYLIACCNVDRQQLAPLAANDSPYDPDAAKIELIRRVYSRRWHLEEMASEMRDLVEFPRAD